MPDFSGVSRKNLDSLLRMPGGTPQERDKITSFGAISRGHPFLNLNPRPLELVEIPRPA